MQICYHVNKMKNDNITKYLSISATRCKVPTFR